MFNFFKAPTVAEARQHLAIADEERRVKARQRYTRQERALASGERFVEPMATTPMFIHRVM